MRARVLIIAEAGVNHNGDMRLARRLIDAAAWAGADFVKFQTFTASRIVTRSAPKASYQEHATKNLESQYDMLSKLEITEQMHHELIAHCNMCQIQFLSTGFDRESISLLESLGQQYFKIPSGEITNLPYLRQIGKLNKTVIMSTGMATMLEVEAAILELERSGTPRANIIALHCTTEYPTPKGEVNLTAMRTMAQSLEVAIGYSDHTQGIEVATAAVALGATVIEKHFTLDRNMPGPDHRASLEPDELKEMVNAIRNIELAMGDGIKRPSACEQKNRQVVRKSIVASRTIKKGEVFTDDNLTTKRPGTGISPMLWDEVIGQRANRDYEADDLLRL